MRNVHTDLLAPLKWLLKIPPMGIPYTRMKRNCALCLLASITLALPAMAQVSTSEISGVVRDTSTAAVAGVTVQAVNEQTSVARTTQTNAEGLYVISNLPPSQYRVQIEHTGFKAFKREHIVLNAGDRRDISAALEIGSVSDVVTVNASGEQVETESGTVGRLVDGAQIRELALNGRNLIQLAMLMPGVATTTDQFDRGGIATGSVANFNFNGTRGTSTSVTVDGGTNQDSGNITGQTNNVSVEFVQEVKVASSAYSAEYGRYGGAQINYTTRSGTDQFHGGLFEFFRNDKLNARSFFAPQVEKLRLNQFGWNLGGPLKLPGLSKNGDKKLFFFVGQEYRRRIDGETRRATLPTHAEREGIISTANILRYPSNFPVESLRGQQIMDPSRGTPQNPMGLNILPRQYMTENGQAIMRIWNAMEQQTIAYSDQAVANNATYQLANRDIRREDIARVDFHLSPRNQFNFRMLYDTGSGFNPYEMGTIPTFQAARTNTNPNFQLAWTSVISSRTVNEAAVVSNYFDLYRAPSGDQRFPDTYGLTINELYGNETQTYGMPSIAIAGYTAISGARDERRSPVWDFSFRDNFSHVVGKHNLKTGILAIRNRKNEQVYFTTGSVTFNPSGNAYTTGNGLLDTLIGNYRQYSETNREKWARIRMTQIEGYIADTWRVRKNLTLDLGLRYSFMPPPFLIDNTASTFIPGYYDPATAQLVIPSGSQAGQLQPGVGQPYNGIVVAGDSFNGSKDTPSDPAAQNLFRGLPRGFYGNQHKFSPRFGFAYDPFGKGTFSIRGGAAIYYDRMPNGAISESGGNPPFVNTVTLFDGKFDELASGRNALFPVAVSGFRPDIQAPATYNWSFGFQKKLWFDSLLDVNYVSTQGRHLLRKPNINQVTPAVQYANSALNINSLRPYQGYTNIAIWETSASSSYHGLQIGLTRRYSSNLTYSVAYTWSKVLTDASDNSTGVENLENYRAERSHATFDRNHILVFSYIYNLPRLSNQNAVVRNVFGGWQWSGVTQFQSGGWLSASINTPTGDRRPDRVGDVSYFDPRQVQTLIGGNGQPVSGNFYFDPTPGRTFVAPDPTRFGNSAPNIIRGPGRHNWDMSVFKNFRPVESVNLQLRGEFFNVWNHTNFRNPNTSAASRDYGTISDAGPPRLIQVALKLTF